jgi:hypothetical protein
MKLRIEYRIPLRGFRKVVLFYRRAVETKISLLITGITHPNCSLVPYSHLDEVEDWITYKLS